MIKIQKKIQMKYHQLPHRHTPAAFAFSQNTTVANHDW